MTRLYAAAIIGLCSVGVTVFAGYENNWWLFVPSGIVTGLSIFACGTYGVLWGEDSA